MQGRRAGASSHHRLDARRRGHVARVAEPEPPVRAAAPAVDLARSGERRGVAVAAVQANDARPLERGHAQGCRLVRARAVAEHAAVRRAVGEELPRRAQAEQEGLAQPRVPHEGARQRADACGRRHVARVAVAEHAARALAPRERRAVRGERDRRVAAARDVAHLRYGRDVGEV